MAATRRHGTNKVQNRIGLVNGTGFLIHHTPRKRAFLRTAFIFRQCQRAMVNRWLARNHCSKVPAVNLALKADALQRSVAMCGDGVDGSAQALSH
jgi:hypothetical protein